jgi:dihydrofolate reductase
MITLIAACSENRVIGKDGTLIWHIPEDLKRFKKLTLGNPIVMGRKTYESIGKPLPGRTNIILTRDKNFKAENCLVYNKISDVLEIFEKNNIFVIGGGEIYKQFLDRADRIELTLIHKNFDGDTYFPQIGNDWEVIECQKSNFENIDIDYISYQKI